jgi:ribonuclease P protein component
MLPKKYRFQSFNFAKFFKSANKKENEFFKVWQAGTNFTYPRLAVSISVKICKKAVDRNKIRRRIFNVLRINLHNIRAADYVIVPKSSAFYINQNDLSQKILDLLTDV